MQSRYATATALLRINATWKMRYRLRPLCLSLLPRVPVASKCISGCTTSSTAIAIVTIGGASTLSNESKPPRVDSALTPILWAVELYALLLEAYRLTAGFSILSDTSRHTTQSGHQWR